MKPDRQKFETRLVHFAAGYTVPLATFRQVRDKAVRYERQARRLQTLNAQLLLLPEVRRAQLNLSDDYAAALRSALDGSEQDFGFFLARYTGP